MSTPFGQLATRTGSRGQILTCEGPSDLEWVQMAKALQECIAELQQAHILWQEILTVKRTTSTTLQGVTASAGVGRNQQNRILDQAFANS